MNTEEKVIDPKQEAKKAYRKSYYAKNKEAHKGYTKKYLDNKKSEKVKLTEIKVVNLTSEQPEQV